MRRKRVADWPRYLLNGIPESERRLLSASAAARNTSVADVVRSILCARYRMNCPRESYYYDAERDAGSSTLLLRLQPKLDAALRREAERTKKSRRRLIIDTITAYYEKETS